MRPSIDHGILSPSGRVSKRSRDAALERARVELFGVDGLELPSIGQPPPWKILRRQAAELRQLAAGGMKPRAYRRKAQELEVKADRLELKGE